jgi:hypothetical protein
VDGLGDIGRDSCISAMNGRIEKCSVALKKFKGRSENAKNRV